MRPPSLRLLVVTLALLAPGLPAPRARAADADLKGTWKLLILDQLMESDLMLVEVKDHGGKLEATVKDSQPLSAPPEVSRVELKNGVVTLALKLGGVEPVFNGKPAGPDSIPGTIKVGDQNIPARLDRTTDAKVAPAPRNPPEIYRDYFSARNEQLPKTRVRLLRAVLAQKPGNPSLAPVYFEVLRDADSAELSEAEVRKVLSQWLEGAKPYGNDFTNDVRMKALRALAGKAPYAPLALELARETDAGLEADSPLKTRAAVAEALADAAKLSGDDTLSRTARAKHARLETELDAEYRKTVPPFTPEASAGPKDRKSDRVVLFELFTGAECPPCVAADVAFDALNLSYKPTQVVTLQYHLHVPGPDPLANPDTQLRAETYPDLEGTPSSYIDGKSSGPSGGPMALAKERYNGYRKLVDAELQKPALATISLDVDRKGDTLKIRASAQTRETGPKLVLRLALVEDEVRYVGGNGVRFHHHVVRGLPGGAAGKPLAGGKGANEVTVDLAAIRKTLEQYLSDYTKEGGSFRKPLPSLALSRLSVVAFVQNDETRNVLNAAIAHVGGGPD